MVEMFNIQRAIAPKVGKPELWIMYSAHRLMVLYIYVKFCENITWRGHKYIVEMTKFKVQRAITLKTGKPELHFMCSAHCLMVLYIAGGFVKISQMVSELWSGHEIIKC